MQLKSLFIFFIGMVCFQETSFANAPCDCSEFTGVCSGTIISVKNDLLSRVYKTETEPDKYWRSLIVGSSTQKCSIVEVMATTKSPASISYWSDLVTVVGGRDEGIPFGQTFFEKGKVSDYRVLDCRICKGSNIVESEQQVPDLIEAKRTTSDLFDDLLGRMRDRRSQLSQIAANVQEQNRSFVDFDSQRINERQATVQRVRNSTRASYENQINNLEQSNSAIMADITASVVARATSSQNQSNSYTGPCGIHENEIRDGKCIVKTPTTLSSNSKGVAEANAKNRCLEIRNSYIPAISAIPIGDSIREQAQNSIKRNNITLEGLNKCLGILPVDTQSYNEVYQLALAVKADSEQSMKIFNQVNVAD